jgi:hypothetical protein
MGLDEFLRQRSETDMTAAALFQLVDLQMRLANQPWVGHLLESVIRHCLRSLDPGLSLPARREGITVSVGHPPAAATATTSTWDDRRSLPRNVHGTAGPSPAAQPRLPHRQQPGNLTPGVQRQ